MVESKVIWNRVSLLLLSLPFSLSSFPNVSTPLILLLASAVYLALQILVLRLMKASRVSEDHKAQLSPGVSSPKSMVLHKGWAGNGDALCSFWRLALRLCNSRLMIRSEGFSEHSGREGKNTSSLGGFHHDSCTTSAIYLNSSHVSYPRFITALKTPLHFTMLKNKFLHSWGNIYFLRAMARNTVSFRAT